MATLEVGVGSAKKDTRVSIVAASSSHNDSVTRATKVVPKGFPYQLFASGLIQYETNVEERREGRINTISAVQTCQ
jgi:hypothetical protein